MFFVKKFVSAFLMPYPIGLLLLFIGVLFLLFRSYKKGRLFVILSFVWLLIFSNSYVAGKLLYPLEQNHKALLHIPNVNYVLVLGGGHNTNDKLSITSQINATSINRLIEGVRIYKELKGAKLIVSGYGGNDKTPHAFMQKKLAIALGVKEEDIITNPTPRDTGEEALEVKKLVKNEKFIMVTSASHMTRAMLLFQKQNLNVIAAPTNHLVRKEPRFRYKPSAGNLVKSQVAVHEYLGIAWGKIKGII